MKNMPLHCPALFINLLSLAVSLRTTRFNIQKFYIVLSLIWVFGTYFSTESEFCFTHN